MSDLLSIHSRTASNVREIQTIARHVLQLSGSKPDESSNTTSSSKVPSPAGGERRGSLGSGAGELSVEDGVLGSLGSMEDVCGWYNLSDLVAEGTRAVDGRWAVTGQTVDMK